VYRQNKNIFSFFLWNARPTHHPPTKWNSQPNIDQQYLPMQKTSIIRKSNASIGWDNYSRDVECGPQSHSKRHRPLRDTMKKIRLKILHESLVLERWDRTLCGSSKPDGAIAADQQGYTEIVLVLPFIQHVVNF